MTSTSKEQNGEPGDDQHSSRKATDIGKKKIMGNAMEKGVFSVTVPDNLTLRAESNVTVLWHSELSCLLLH